MNIIQENIEKYKPRIIEYENVFFICFIDETEKSPTIYYKFSKTLGKYDIIEKELPVKGDKIHKISLELYFIVSQTLMKQKKKYNLKKNKYELNKQ